MSLARVFLAEIQTLHRGRFALLGAFVLTGLVALLGATVGPGAAYRPEFLIPTYVIATAFLVPVTAVAIARARAAHFLEGVFTSPVSQTHYLFGKWATSLALGICFILATLPFALLQALHLGFVPLTWKFVLMGAGMVLYTCSLGLLLGLLFTGRSIVPTLSVATAAAAILVAMFVFLRPVHALAAGPTRDLLLTLLHASGAVLLHDALGLDPLRSEQPLASLLALAAQVAGFLGGAWYLFTRAQSVQQWELRLPIVAVAPLLLLVLLAPAAVANDAYEELPQESFNRGSSTQNMTVRLTPPQDEPPRPDPFPTPPVLAAHATNDRVLWVFVFGVPLGAHVSDVRLRIETEGMRASPAEFHLRELTLLPRAEVREGQPPVAYLRVPLVLQTPPPQSLSQNSHLLHLDLVYHVEGADAPRTADGYITVHSQVEDIHRQLAIGMGATPILLVTGYGVRRWRMK